MSAPNCTLLINKGRIRPDAFSRALVRTAKLTIFDVAVDINTGLGKSVAEAFASA